MLTVTAAARNRLSQKLDRKKATGGAALRFTRKTGGWRLRLDEARPDDTVFQHEGRDVLLLDADATEAMAALTLDVTRTDAGAKLKLRRIRRGSE